MARQRHRQSIRKGGVRRRDLCFGALVALAILGFGREASARTCTWNATGTGTNLFSTSTNWSCSTGSGPPIAGDTAQYDATSTKDCSINAAVSATNISVNAGYTGTISTSGSPSITLTGNLTVSAGAFAAGSASLAIGGTVTIANSVSNGNDPSLVGYWKLDETASPAVDSSGNGNSLTWNGTPASSTSFPSAVTFTDTHSLSMTGTQYAGSAVLSGLSELTPATVTVSAWYKATSLDTSGSEIVSGSNTYGLRLTSTGLTVMKRISDNTSAADWIEYRVPETNLTDGNWHQIVGIITTGTGGGMAAYLDAAIATGTYWVNGSSGATQLSASTTPTAAAAASSAIDWDANTKTFGLTIGNNPSTTGYHFGAGCSAGACAIDDVRVYNRALTAAEVTALAHGNQPSSAAGLLSLSGSLTANVGLNVQSAGTLTLASGSTVAVGTASVAGSVTVDGTLNSTAGTIKAVSASHPYAFKVGSAAAAAPNLNINGLSVQNTDSNGMWINANTGAVTTFTQFDKVAFSSGTGTQLLQIYAPTLYLSSNGCTFDGSTTVAVKLTGNGTGSGAGPRALFGNATCATNDSTSGLCATSEKSDDDANNDGVPDHPTTNGAVVQFVRSAQVDTDGTLVGFPTAAFDWNTFSYYSTYAAFHDASTGSDVVYVRDESGNPLYSWTDPTADETITGTPQWISTTVSSVTTHYLYVSVNGGSSNSGKVYRLKDTGTGTTSGTLTLDTSWATSGAFSCTCTITSGLSLDANNIYWAATTASAQVLMGLVQSSGAKISTSWPVTTPANVTTSSPTLSTVAGTTTLYLGATADLLQLAVTGTTFVQDTKPGTITGRVSFGTSALAATYGTSRVYAGDSAGNMTAISPTDFTGTHFLWSYAAGSAITNNYYDLFTDTVAFGTAGGTVVVLNAAGSGTGGSLLNSDYPYTLDASDPITAAPLYVNGVLAVATTLGKLYLLDRNTGLASPNGVSILRQYSFGPAQSISSIGYDPNMTRYMVATSSAANDGRIYYFDAVSDPTPTFQ